MDITMSLILTRFFDDYPEYRIDLPKELRNTVIKGIYLLPRSSEQKLRDHVLYLYDDSYSEQIRKSDNSTIMMKITSQEPPGIVENNQIILHGDLEIAVLLSALQDVFSQFVSWHSNLERMLLEGDSIQDMINWSEPLLNTPVLFYDPSLKVVGHTMNIETGDQVYNEVVHQGYLSEKLIQHFKLAHIFQDLNQKGDIQSSPDEIKGHHDYILRLQDGNTLLGYGVLLQSDINREYQKYLFRVLSRMIREKLQRDLQQIAEADYLLQDILDRTLDDPEVIRERSNYLRLEYESDYVLLQLTFMDENNVSGQYVADVFSGVLPNARVFVYNEEILALIRLKKLSKVKYRIQLQKIRERIEQELNQQRMRACVSKSFHALADLRTAYEQCQVCLRLGAQGTFLFYEDFWLQHIFLLCDGIMPLSSFCEPVIPEIASLKQNGAVPPLEILRVYLENDRNLTRCAEKLHMHRNNVIYHIDKLEERYSLDLDNSDQRLRLMISLKIYDYQNKEILP